jgi:uncharacterized protein
MKNNHTALVTGATSGFGHEFAKLFARDGYDLVIVARNRRNLSATAKELSARFGITVTPIAKDLSKPKAAFELHDEIRKKKISIDVLINNAGFGTYGRFHTTEIGSEAELVTLNVLSAAMLMKLFLADMVEKKRGRILNVASMGAFQPGPYMANYCASKAYLLSLSEGVAAELHGTGITVSVLCPGVVITGFQERAKNIHVRIHEGKHQDAATVARIGYRGLMKGQVVIIPEMKSKFLVSLNRIFPRSLVRYVVRKMMEE